MLTCPRCQSTNSLHTVPLVGAKKEEFQWRCVKCGEVIDNEILENRKSSARAALATLVEAKEGGGSR